jgi:Ca2+-binding RTX toxin-like protein
MKRAGVLWLGAALLCAVPATADGATIGGYEWRGPPAVVYTAAPGEVNDVKIRTRADGTLVLTDPGKVITIADDATLPYACVPGVGIAMCKPPGTTPWISAPIHLGDGNDRARVESAYSVGLDGGPGDDVLAGGPGFDSLQGGPGADDLSGGGSVDTANFSDHAGAVTVTLDGAANDGAPGENDVVRGDVENVDGSDAADTIVGDAGPNVLSGGGGDDRIAGGPGDDDLRGWLGDDVVEGGAGEDRIDGSYGDDTLLALDGERDVLGCAEGVDTARRDPFDASFFTDETCEVIEP